MHSIYKFQFKFSLFTLLCTYLRSHLSIPYLLPLLSSPLLLLMFIPLLALFLLLLLLLLLSTALVLLQSEYGEPSRVEAPSLPQML